MFGTKSNSNTKLFRVHIMQGTQRALGISCARDIFVFLSTEIGAMLYINIYFFDTDYEVLSYRVEWYTKKE